MLQQFGKGYQHFINLNLERPSDRKYFEREREIREVWEQIIFEKKLPNDPANTLLFIDEIQEIPATIKQLRYFYEDMPELHVVAAGSLLEFALGEVKSFPVGRIEELTLHPLDFEEFLMAVSENAALEQLRKVPLNDFAYDKLFEQYKRYIIIGGMPGVVRKYVETQFDLASLREVYASVWDTYKSDVIKYAKNATEANVMRHIITTAPYVRDRISFAGFGASNYRSREVGEAFRALDLAKIIYLIYPTTQTAPPQTPDLTRKPRLQFLDTGLLNYASDIQAELLLLDDLNEYYKGFAVNHAITQELIANSASSVSRPHFWVRENTNANAEVDMTYKWRNLLLPVEVKSGAKGSLRSLHEYMELTPHDLAVRFLGNKVSIEKCTTKLGKEFKLLNLPYFACTQLGRYVEWAMAQ
ncbi:MAG: AAA family ATPase [Saprospiraceae bacterium]|nr:AAA family ATPase [Saprospiraceae bacterium]